MRITSIVLGLAVLCGLPSVVMAETLKSLEQRGKVTEALAGLGVNVETPIGTRLARSPDGSPHSFLPYMGRGRMNANRSGMNMHLEPGWYRNLRSGKKFKVRPQGVRFQEGTFGF